MNKEEAKRYIEERLSNSDKLVGYFIAQGPFPIWWFLLLGPFGALFLKTYYIAVTNNGINFYRLSLMGKFKDDGDFFGFDEIESVKIKSGMMQRPMIFTLGNARKVKIKAQLKGLERVAKLTDETQRFIEKNITVAT
jgi:hypothetical protein